MTRYLLDTNIVSALVRPVPPPGLVVWMAGQPDAGLFIASLTLAELWKGIQELPVGGKRRTLEAWFSGPAGPEAIFKNRILPFETGAAIVWGRLMAEGRRLGRPRSPLDMIIAATAEAHGLTVVTDNARDFWGLEFINPIRDQAE